MTNFLILQQATSTPSIVLIIVISTLFAIQTIVQYRIFKKRRTLSHGYPVNTFLMLAPIYEEIIFRGFLFFGLIPVFGVLGSAIINAILFGLWHIRSIFFMPEKKVIIQILYTTLVIAPVCLYATHVTGNIWIAVIIHYLNNILAPICEEWEMFK